MDILYGLIIINRCLNGFELFPEPNIQIDSNNEVGSHALSITDVTSVMQGEVVAKAMNKLGECLISAKLEVRGSAPTFIETPIKCAILEGEIVMYLI